MTGDGNTRKQGLLAIIGPGILVAATGIGTGDIASGSIAGSKLGLGILWAVLVGAGLKFVLSEGLARWQLATGDTLLEGCVDKFGVAARGVFLVYLLFWSVLVAAAIMGGTGIALYAVIDNTWRNLHGRSIVDSVPGFDARTGKIVLGITQSLLAVALIRSGGFRLFEKVLSACIAVMFITVVATAVAVNPSWNEVARGILVPVVPVMTREGVQWTIALLGGIGGTVTLICYGYWIREEGRMQPDQLGLCRLDLAVAYLVIALFGLSMVVIGSRVQIVQEGELLIIHLAERLHSELSPAFGRAALAAKWGFLVGAWAAAIGSMLGVWQSVPYIFSDFWSLLRYDHAIPRAAIDTESRPYRYYLYALGTVPIVGLFGGFVTVQKVYTIVGAAFIPMLAVVLLVLNGRTDWVGKRYRNSWLTSLLLLVTLGLFVAAAWYASNGKIKL